MKDEAIDLFKIPGYEAPLSFVYTPPKFDFDAMCAQVVQNIGIKVNKEQLICIISGDRKRYEEAYRKGYEAAKAEYDARLAAIARIAQEGAEQ